MHVDVGFAILEPNMQWITEIWVVTRSLYRIRPELDLEPSQGFQFMASANAWVCFSPHFGFSYKSGWWVVRCFEAIPRTCLDWTPLCQLDWHSNPSKPEKQHNFAAWSFDLCAQTSHLTPAMAMIHGSTVAPAITAIAMMMVHRSAMTPSSAPADRVVVHIGGAMTPSTPPSRGIVMDISTARATAPARWIVANPVLVSRCNGWDNQTKIIGKK